MNHQYTCRFITVFLIIFAITMLNAEEHLIETEKPTITNKRGMPTLPVMEEGEWEGYHMLYSTKNYDAVMDHYGRLTMLIKKGDEYVGPGIRVGDYWVYYKDVGNKNRKLTAIKSSIEAGEKNPKKVTLTLTFDSKVKTAIIFEFKKDTIIYSGFIHANSVKPSTIMHLITRHVKTHEIPDDMEQVDRVKLLKKYKLNLKFSSGRKKKITFLYSDLLNKEKFGTLSSAEITGFWGKKKYSHNY